MRLEHSWHTKIRNEKERRNCNEIPSERTIKPNRADQEKGQTLIEYALIILLVSIVVMVVLAALGVEVTNVFQEIIDTFSPPAPPPP